MARYRIVRRPNCLNPFRVVYDVQRQVILTWWDTVSSSWSSLEEAEQVLMGFKKAATISWKPEVVKEYD